MAEEIQQVLDAIPWSQNGDANLESGPAQFSVESAILQFMLPGNGSIAPHWSLQRDRQLRKLWRDVDPFKIAVNTFVNKAVTIPLRIHARNRTIRRHVLQAQQMTEDLHRNSGVLAGWKTEFKKFITDYLTQDNGGHMLVMGTGPANQPLVGRALGILQLDSARCQRTGDARFPIIYTHTDSKRYKLHYSRVITISNLPSSEYDLYNVGHCAVSCAMDAGIELRDIYAYMQEKLGSRPKRQIIFAKSGTTRDRMIEAFDYADDKMDSEALSRFAKTVLMAPKNPNGTLDIGMIDLASTPDHFNRRDTAIIDISAIAAAFGLDPQDLSMTYGTSAGTQRSTEVQERKGRGKGVGELLETTAAQIDEKFLPPHLYSTFDNQDDAQDSDQAEIWNLRSTARQRDLTTGSTTVQVERARMLRTAEITEDEFMQMELLDGRLASGLSVVSLFSSKDSFYNNYLDFGVDKVTNPEKNDVESILDQIDEREEQAYLDFEVAPTHNITRKLFEVLAALGHLRALYEGFREQEELLRVEEEMRSQEAGMEPALAAEAEGAGDPINDPTA